MRVRSYIQESIDLATGQRQQQAHDFTELQAQLVNAVLDDDGLTRLKALELINKWNTQNNIGTAPIRWVYTIS
jgi:hypothetical protein